MWQKPYYLFLVFINFFFFQRAEAFECRPVDWVSPPKSQKGIFTGDLQVQCELLTSLSILDLKKKMIEKIQTETILHQGPLVIQDNPPWIQWEVSHRFLERGDSISIREKVFLKNISRDELNYETQSQEIHADGMAGYLKSVRFEMKVRWIDHRFLVVFRNCVQIERPWFALEGLFVPIARDLCLEKMKKVQNIFLDWIS